MSEAERLFAEFLAAEDRGRPIDPEAFVAAHTPHASELGELLAEHLRMKSAFEPDAEAVRSFERLSEGTVLGEFRLRREIGRGGMGVVYEAEQLSLGRLVAVKVLDDAASGAFGRERFVREAGIAARLQHPAIASVYGAGEQDGTCFFAMELVAGAGLDEVLDACRLIGRNQVRGSDLWEATRRVITDRFGEDQDAPETEEGPRDFDSAALRIAVQVAEAIGAAHEETIVHRDVKPSNVLLRSDGTIVLTDFGLAIGEDVPRVTRSGDFTGTVAYVSPEQARGERNLDAKSDVFSLGVTLYELFTLARPFTGNGIHEVLSNIMGAEPAPLRALASSVPPDVETIIRKALEKRRADRYRDANALAADLRRARDGDPIEARAAGAWALGLRSIRRHRVPVAIAVLLLVSLALAWRLGTDRNRLTVVRAAFEVRSAIAAGRPPDAEDLAQLGELFDSEAARSMFLRDPRAGESWERIESTLSRWRASEAGDTVPSRLLGPRGTIATAAPTFRFALEPLGGTFDFAVVVESDEGVVARAVVTVDAGGAVDVPWSAFDTEPLPEGAWYRWTAQIDPTLGPEASLVPTPTPVAFRVASSSRTAQVLVETDTGDDVLDALVLAIRANAAGYAEASLEALARIPPTQTPELAAFVDLLAAEAAAEIGDAEEVATRRRRVEHLPD